MTTRNGTVTKTQSHLPRNLHYSIKVKRKDTIFIHGKLFNISYYFLPFGICCALQEMMGVEKDEKIVLPFKVKVTLMLHLVVFPYHHHF